MPKVRFDDGTVINFDSTPSDQDIEEAYSHAQQIKGSTPTSRLAQAVTMPPGRGVDYTAGSEAMMRGMARTLPAMGMMGSQLALNAFLPGAGLPLEMLASGIGGTAGRFASEAAFNNPIKPSTLAGEFATDAAFPGLFEGAQGLIGKAPGWIANLLRPGTVLGSAAAGGLASGGIGAAQGALNPVNPEAGLTEPGGRLQTALNEGLGSIPSGALGSGFAQAIPNALDRLSGKSLKIAKEKLANSSDEITLSMRRGGNLEQKVADVLKERADEAWKPMKDLATSITEPITAAEINQTADSTFANDPERLASVKDVLKKSFSAPSREIGGVEITMGGKRIPGDVQKLLESTSANSLTASELVDLSSQLGEKIAKGARSGKSAIPGSDLAYSDARSVIANVLEAKAPDNLKGNVQLAKNQWEDYIVGFRNPMKQFFQPGRSMEEFTSPGVDFLMKIAEGKADPSEMRFAKRVEKELGVDLINKLEKLGSDVAKESSMTWLTRMATRIGIFYPTFRGAIRAAGKGQ